MTVTVEQLKSHPTGELKQFTDIAQEHSRHSGSTVRKDFVCKDGVLVATSHNGGPVQFTVEPPPARELPGE